MMCFPVKFAKCLRTPILKKCANDCFWNYWIISCGKINWTPTFPQINQPAVPDNPRARSSHQRFSFKKGVLKKFLFLLKETQWTPLLAASDDASDYFQKLGKKNLRSFSAEVRLILIWVIYQLKNCSHR